MDAEFSRRKLVTRDEMRALTERSDLWGGVQMASHIGAILVVGALHALAMGTWMVWVTGFVLGVLLNPCNSVQNPQGQRGLWPHHRVFHDFPA